MQKIHHSIKINAPAKKVWETVIGDKTYLLWTAPFSEGLSLEAMVEGNWEEGSEIRFLARNETGGVDGMFSTIAESRPYEFLSIKHLGEIKDGVVDTESERVKAWTPAFENYTFKEVDGVTEFTVDMDSADEYAESLDGSWPKALLKLKELAEQG